jgi:glycosyltransferase involved in cell wall biosynthesis
MDLSVVIVARNEEASIGRSLEALTRELAGRSNEIILVDSASTDRTVEIARSHAIRIIHLEPGPLLSPAAGRYMGTFASSGEFILFLDGDMILIPGWIDRAMKELQAGHLAAVVGRLYWVRPGESLSMDHPDDAPCGIIPANAPSYGIYRRAVLERSGTFNPYIKGEEEIELGYRIVREGFELRRIDVPMVYHVDKPRDSRAVHQKARYFAGTGQILRRYAGTALWNRLVRNTLHVFAQQAALLVPPVGALCALALGAPALAMVLLVVFAGVILALTAWKGPSKVFLYLRSLLLITWYMMKGFFRGLPDGRGFENHIRYTITGPHG